MFDLRRREFMALLGGAAATWPLGVSAQQPPRPRRIGVLINMAADDPEGHARITALAQGLEEAGWASGRNVRIDYRWGGGGAAVMAKRAAELVALAPDVILATTSASVAALQQITRAIPIVFVQVIDPVSADGQVGAIQSVAPSLGIELRPVDAHEAGEIERAVTTFARSGNGGLIVLSGSASLAHRELIIALAVRERLPAVYSDRVFVYAGGLISYDPNRAEQYRRAAGYIDRVLKGEKPADLPVQAPTQYELAINIKTAKALGLTVPTTLLARANEVIE
jgi:putative tryptophan/tyrosine transport system substrate-binding protein